MAPLVCIDADHCIGPAWCCQLPSYLPMQACVPSPPAVFALLLRVMFEAACHPVYERTR